MNTITHLPRKRSGFWSIVRTGLWSVCALVVSLILVGLLYQWIATSRDMRLHPAPGRLVDVDGVRLHYVERGTDGPTAVFDSPSGASGLGWALVEPEVAKFSHTFTLDRQGLGWSEAGPRPQDSERTVEQLHTLLKASGVPSPYVLVGASLGAVNLRLFAFRYPEEVAGMVLVDPAHEEMFTGTPPLPRPPLAPLRLFQIASRIGLLRLADMPVDVAGMNVLSSELQPAARAVGFRSDAVDAIVAETAAIEQSFEEVRRARIAAGPQPSGDRPLIVLTRQEATPPKGDELAMYRRWVELHEALAAESTRGEQRFVPESGHFIAIDQPAVVVGAIREVLDAVREPRPLAIDGDPR